MKEKSVVEILIDTVVDYTVKELEPIFDILSNSLESEDESDE